MGICILNNLDIWLDLAQSETELEWEWDCYIQQESHKSLLLRYLEHLGLMVNFANILSPSQRMSFLGAVFDSTYKRAVDLFVATFIVPPYLSECFREC